MKNTETSIIEKRTSNNIRIVFAENPNFSTCAAQVSFNYGFRHLTDKERVMLHIIEHLCLEGNEQYQDIEQTFSRKGGWINGEIDAERMDMTFESHPSLFLKNIEIFLNIIRNPHILGKNINNVKNIIIEEIKGNTDDINSYTNEEVYTNLWGSDHYVKEPGFNVIESVTKEEIEEFLPIVFQPKHFCILIATCNGEELDDYLSIIEKYFSEFKNSDVEFVPKIFEVNKNLPLLSVIPFNHSQTSLTLSYAANKKPLDTSSIKADLLAKFLGEEGQGGFLFKEIRKKRGLVYEISCEVIRNNYELMLNITSHQSHNRTKEVVVSLINEINLLPSKFFNDKSLEEAKEDFIHELNMGKDEAIFWITFLAQDTLAGIKNLSEVFEDYSNNIKALTLSDLEDYMHNLLSPRNMMLMIVGPIDPLEVKEYQDIALKLTGTPKVYLSEDTLNYSDSRFGIWAKIRQVLRK